MMILQVEIAISNIRFNIKLYKIPNGKCITIIYIDRSDIHIIIVFNYTRQESLHLFHESKPSYIPPDRHLFL